ncbi:toprim domain-containing protein [Alsobacter sp. KACC 23698]|uniref:Toprim domain-containing protein n=1 Tax=Alsobacter sp. KACC 23698 TaxID=3149229 RepID=A0AAU7JBW5_9HYPH
MSGSWRWYDFELGNGGDVLDFIQHETGGTLRDALIWAKQWRAGLPVGARHANSPAVDVDASIGRSRLRLALKIWRESVSADGTLAAAYLAQRGLSPSTATRFHAACAMKVSEGRYEPFPAMVHSMVDITTGQMRAVHRTFLSYDGRKIANIAKRVLGSSSGTAVDLCPEVEVTTGLGITEGVETGLTLVQRGWRPVWALGSAGAIARFPVLPGVEALTIFADHDMAGLSAARDCATRWLKAGRECRIIPPRSPGQDWNDVIRTTDDVSEP